MSRPDSAAAYTYGVARPFDPARLTGLRGVDGGRVTLIRHHDVAAVVSAMPHEAVDEETLAARLEDLAELERLARSHHAVVEAVAAHAVTLPFRLVTIHRGERRVADLLRRRRAHFGAALDRVAGRVEMGIKLHALPGLFAEDGDGDGGAEPRSTSPGRDYLRRRRQETDRRVDQQRRTATVAQQVHADLARLAVAHELHRTQDQRLSRAPGENLLNAAYLVSDRRVDAFVARANEMAATAAGVTLTVTGPWVPYSFAQVDDEADA